MFAAAQTAQLTEKAALHKTKSTQVQQSQIATSCNISKGPQHGLQGYSSLQYLVLQMFSILVYVTMMASISMLVNCPEVLVFVHDPRFIHHPGPGPVQCPYWSQQWWARHAIIGGQATADNPPPCFSTLNTLTFNLK